jgi:hypothetical protein
LGLGQPRDVATCGPDHRENRSTGSSVALARCRSTTLGAIPEAENPMMRRLSFSLALTGAAGATLSHTIPTHPDRREQTVRTWIRAGLADLHHAN